jgi:DNA-binding HxlR family transcriptional regulator
MTTMSYNSSSYDSNVIVSVTIGDLKVQFNGSPQSVLTSVITFLSKQIPTFDLAKRISLSYSTTELIESFASLIKITPEGPKVIPDSREDEMKKISDKQVVALQLVASKIAKELGRSEHDGMSLSEIQSATALNPKSVSSRLSELVKTGYVLRDNTKNGIEAVLYRITTIGIHWLNSALSKKIM